eukprot:TRINITY_DN66738_c0_g1_i1.p1 TRINITY_DN66738_c0_g1~~TRINITY_DN66738_c0_g1_i1.p1  ORF type:complete len:336 (-),score=59.29 TRINITY_DN66738_c0_g1_i1:97-1104(-)
MGQGISADGVQTTTPGATHDPTEQKVRQLHDLYVKLEVALANPEEARPIGEIYEHLRSFYVKHQWDLDLQLVLEALSADDVYPMWRRQALEEAYRLFYDDVASRGLEELNLLPEPPTSEEIGFRQLPEALVSSRAAEVPVYKGCFEDVNSFMFYKKRWEYEILRTSDQKRVACGRSISSTGFWRHACATEIMSKAAQVVLPMDMCCAKREDARAARGPFFLPQGPRGGPAIMPNGKIPSGAGGAAESFGSNLPSLEPHIITQRKVESIEGHVVLERRPPNYKPSPPMRSSPAPKVAARNGAYRHVSSGFADPVAPESLFPAPRPGGNAQGPTHEI